MGGFSCASAAAAAVRENVAHTVFSAFFPPVSVGLGLAAGDAFFGGVDGLSV